MSQSTIMPQSAQSAQSVPGPPPLVRETTSSFDVDPLPGVEPMEVKVTKKTKASKAPKTPKAPKAPKAPKTKTADTNEPKPKRAKRGPKNYSVSIPHHSGASSVIHSTKSGPIAATSAAVRGIVKTLPLRTPVKVWTKSRNKVHQFHVTRDYDNEKHRRFSVVRAGPSVGLKQIKEEHDVPQGLV